MITCGRYVGIPVAVVVGVVVDSVADVDPVWGSVLDVSKIKEEENQVSVASAPEDAGIVDGVEVVLGLGGATVVLGGVALDVVGTATADVEVEDGTEATELDEVTAEGVAVEATVEEGLVPDAVVLDPNEVVAVAEVLGTTPVLPRLDEVSVTSEEDAELGMDDS